MITADELLIGAADVGLRVNNLFQVAVGSEEMWQANVRDASGPKECFEFGRGTTPVAALIAAYRAAGVTVDEA